MANGVFDKDLLEKLRKELKFQDPGIFEKTVYAFRLLNRLVKVYPDLVFKGGSSIFLHIFPPVRFSIDIDILLKEQDKKDIENNLQRVISESGIFDELKEDKREKNIPKVHYKFYYDSYYARNKQYILLDIVFCNPPYHELIRKNLDTCSLAVGASTTVRVPTVEGLFGDKLTAISPKTIGIQLNAKREMEFVKQVIDLGFLFEHLNNIEDIHKTFQATARLENVFRKTNHSEEKIFEDISNVAFKYCQYLLRGANHSFKEVEHINSGLKRVSNHLLGRYTQSDLKLSFAKISYVCRLLRDSKKSEILKKVDYKLIERKTLSRKYQVLQGLKKTNPQAYFYWVYAIS